MESGLLADSAGAEQGALGHEETALMGGTFRAETVHAGDYWPQSAKKPELCLPKTIGMSAVPSYNERSTQEAS